MKKIEAIIRKEKFEEVIKVLENFGVGGVTVTEAVGFGHHRNGLKEKMKIDIYADVFQVDKIVDMIKRSARTGTTGDGKIVVLDLEDIHKIRTGENGASVI